VPLPRKEVKSLTEGAHEEAAIGSKNMYQDYKSSQETVFRRT
jgi:hypothetical protein